MTPAPRDAERGMILINVLLIVALAASVVVLMVSARDTGIDRSLMMREAARARAVALGGEASAVTALRRDMTEAPETDHKREAWAAVIQPDAPIAGGRFSLDVIDARAKFNVNALAGGAIGARAMLADMLAALGYPPEYGPLIARMISTAGPLASLEQLALGGVDAATIARLRTIADALPVDGPINLNTADGPVLSLLLHDSTKARQLLARRAATGFLTASDLASVGAATPSGSGFTSDLFYVVTRVRIGGTEQVLTSLVRRRTDDARRPHAEVIGRWWGTPPV